jgi:RecA-family ATPase
MLRGLALRHSTTILLLYHPSLSGMSSGSGTSGNVAWGNSVRSRIYLERLKDSEGRDIDSNKRKLEVKKANRAASGVVIPLRYAAGRFVREGDAIAASDVAETAEKAFLALLDQFEAEQRPVSHQVVCRNYAPRMFAEHHRSGGLTKADFKRAMDRLFEQTVIRIAPYGRAGRQFEKIVKTDTKSELQPRIENNDLLG